MIKWDDKPFYTGFTITKDKATVYKRDNPNFLHSLKQVSNLNEFSAVIATNSAVFDSDDEINSEKLLKLIKCEKLGCMVTNRKDGRGYHVAILDNDELIKNKATNVMLACGITVDILLGRKNGIETLKLNGIERKIIYDFEPYQQLPKYLTPVKCKIDFAGMGEGDGRNQALFNYILTLQNHDFNNDEIKECIRIINKYILKTPLSESELETILRDEAFKKMSFFSGRKFLHDKFASYMKNTYHIKRINDRIHFFKNVYIHNKIGIFKLMVKEVSNLTKNQRMEAYTQLEIICDNFKESNADLKYIAFRNGVLDISTGELKPFSPDYIITNQIPWDYNPNAYDVLMDKTLNKYACNDTEIRALLEEVVGGCFYRSGTYGGGKLIFFTGDKYNGKSTFMATIITTLGEENIVSKNVHDFSNNRFSSADLFGKLANIGDDIPDKYIDDTSIIKKISTSSMISSEKKNEDGFDYKPYAKLIFSANETPRIKDPTGAVQRRLLIIPFNAHFTKSDPDYDPQFEFKLQTQPAIEYLIKLGVEGLKRVLKNKGYSESIKVNEELDNYDLENNPVKAFVNEIGIDDINNEPCDTIFNKYKEFIIKNNLKSAFSKTKLTQQLKLHFSFESVPKTVQGKSIRIYQFKTVQ